MKGKILAKGLISADNGERYTYTINDILNLDGRSEDGLINGEVDFKVDGEKAKDIFITKEAIRILGGGAMNIKTIKIFGYIYAGSFILALIPFIGIIFGIIGFVAMLVAIYHISNMSKTSLLKYFIICWVLAFIGGVIMMMSAGGGMMGMMMTGFKGGSAAAIGVFAILGIIIALAFFIAAFYCGFKYASTLANVTNEKFFLYAFFCHIAGFVFIWTVILAAIIFIAGAVLEIIAWVKFKEIRQLSQE